LGLPARAANRSLSVQLYDNRVDKARCLSACEKLRDGLEFSGNALERMKMNIRMRRPGARDGEILDLLRSQLVVCVRRLSP